MMDRLIGRSAQVYGYAVCFVTVIVMLMGIKQVVDAAFDLSDPIRAEGGGYGRMGRTLRNFELYKIDARRGNGGRETPMAVQPRSSADTLSDAELRRLYDAEREQAIGSTRFRAIRSLIGNILLIVLAAILFAVHWRWLKTRDVLAGT
ncbi:MAG: hypothetical protein ACJ8AE_07115 [Gemmatimonadaceae bacterium]